MNLIFNPDSKSPESITNTIRSICPLSQYIELNIEKLNLEPLFSDMNYDTDELNQGPLQLRNGTILIIDERFLEAASLSQIGRFTQEYF